MDKNQATEFIRKRLQNGYSQETIAEELSRMLKAPQALTDKFVRQVAESQPQMPPPVPSPVQKEQPDRLHSLGGARVAAQDDDTPPGLAKIIEQGYQASEQPETAMAFEAAATPGRASPPGFAPVSPARKPQASLAEKPLKDVDLQKLSTDVLQQLKKQRRHNDVVEQVCHATGWHWNQSQRFVARLQTEHHEELGGSQNRRNVFIGAVIIFFGIVFMLYGGAVIAQYFRFTQQYGAEFTLYSDISRDIPIALMALGTGFLMILGGSFGIIKSLMNR
jgi:hypothetical protein